MKKYSLLTVLFVAVFALFSLPLLAQQNNGKGLSKGQEKGAPIKAPNTKKDKQLPNKNGKKDAPELIRPKKKGGDKTPANAGESKVLRPQKPVAKPNTPAEKLKKPTAKSNNGNAHGKNKGELKGKEFGQKRATDAKQKAVEKRQETKKTIQKGMTQLDESKVRIKTARVKLAADVKANKISKDEAAKREAAIKNAEQQLIDLEKSIEKGTARLRG